MGIFGKDLNDEQSEVAANNSLPHSLCLCLSICVCVCVQLNGRPASGLHQGAANRRAKLTHTHPAAALTQRDQRLVVALHDVLVQLLLPLLQVPPLLLREVGRVVLKGHWHLETKRGTDVDPQRRVLDVHLDPFRGPLPKLALSLHGWNTKPWSVLCQRRA